MSISREAHVAASFANIHNIITRGLKVSIESLQAASQNGFQDEGRREGLYNYVRALCSVLAVAFSRVYLGVHYPSDTLGAMIFASLWLMVIFAIHDRYVRQVEQSSA